MRSGPGPLLVLASTLVLGTASRNAVPVSNVADLVLADLTEYPHARCIDGSPAAMYYREGLRDGKDKWMIVLEGGGLCDSVEDCTGRSKTGLGSSKGYAPTMDLDSVALCTTDEANPFREWNQVYARYCDGSLWTGKRESADASGLWFSGHHSVAALADFIKNTGNAGQIVFSGGSAGGFGVFNNLDFFAGQFDSAATMVLGAPVGGFPPGMHWYTGPNATVPGEDGRESNAGALVELWGSYLPDECSKALSPTKESDLCVFPHRMYDYIEKPIFIIEAFTDSVIMCDFSGLPCDLADIQNPAAVEYIREYAANFTSSAKRVQPRSPRDGIFAASCFMHTEFSLTGPFINGTNAIVALHQWYESHVLSYQFTGKLIPKTASTKNGAGDYVWEDECKDGQYWPPCGVKCTAN